jgi:hypothetical protein
VDFLGETTLFDFLAKYISVSNSLSTKAFLRIREMVSGGSHKFFRRGDAERSIMTSQEEKNGLLKSLCGSLPYGNAMRPNNSRPVLYNALSFVQLELCSGSEAHFFKFLGTSLSVRFNSVARIKTGHGSVCLFHHHAFSSNAFDGKRFTTLCEQIEDDSSGQSAELKKCAVAKPFYTQQFSANRTNLLAKLCFYN